MSTSMKPSRARFGFLAVCVAAWGLVASGALARGYTKEEAAAVGARWDALAAMAGQHTVQTEAERAIDELLDRWDPIWDRDLAVLQAQESCRIGQAVEWTDEESLGAAHREILDDLHEWLDDEQESTDAIALASGRIRAFRSLCLTAMATSSEDPNAVIAVGLLSKRVRLGSPSFTAAATYSLSRDALARGLDLGCNESDLRRMRPDASELPRILAHDALQIDSLQEQFWGEDEFWRLVWRDARIRRVQEATSGRVDFASLAEEPVLEWPSRTRRWVIDRLQVPATASAFADTILSGLDRRAAREYLAAAADFDAALD